MLVGVPWTGVGVMARPWLQPEGWVGGSMLADVV